MRKIRFVLMAMMSAACLFAVDGVVLINQSTVINSGGFPYQITQSGSYKLTGNLTVPDANTTAIYIRANDVTLDLNGFGIIGPTVCAKSFSPYAVSCAPTGGGNGVYAPGIINAAVANGFVRGMGMVGVWAESIHNVRALSNGQTGLVSFGTVSGSAANLNGQDGIFVGDAIASGNTAGDNGRYGFNVACPSNIIGNLASRNVGTNLNIIFGGVCTAANNNAP